MLLLVVALTVGRIQADHKSFSMCSLCFNLFGRNSTYE